MISFVVPVYNEKESIEAFYQELKKYLPKLAKTAEIIFVDDGSDDGTLDILKSYAKNDKTVRIFSFRRNQGKAEALTLGFQKAQGDFVVTMDADLQDKPSEIHKLFEKMRENGWDMVSGWRKNRQDPIHKVISSKIFNFFARTFWSIELHDYNCGLKLYTADTAKSLNLYGGFHRFIPLIADQQGFTVTEVAIVHDIRKYGHSKYGFSKLWKDLPDIFTMLFLARYSKRPLHFFGIIGSVFTLLGVAILSYFTFIHFVFNQAVGRRPLFLMGMLFVIAGFQIFFTGFIAELIINISHKQTVHFPIKYSTDK